MGHPELSIGKIRGLQACANEAGVFTILAFDHRGSFSRMLGGGSSASYDEVVDAKAMFTQILSPHASAILLDPLYSAGQAIAMGVLPGRTGLLVGLEESGYTGEPTERMTSLLDDWSVLKIKMMGANAVKLLIFYHPKASGVTRKLERLVKGVAQDCKKHDLPFFLEPMSYSIDLNLPKEGPEFANQKPKIAVETARRLSKIGPDVLKLEFPVDARYEIDERAWAKACDALSDACERPWVLLSSGVDYEIYRQQVRIACQHGASGFIAGRAIWKDAFKYTGKQQVEWLERTGVDHLDELTEIATKYARPWTDLFPNMEDQVREGWYRSY